MADDGSEICIADLVERIALGERMRLDLEVVEVGHALHGRLGIVAAVAVLIVELAPKSLLIAERDLFDFQRDFLSRFVGCKRGELIAARRGSESNVGRDLAAGIGEAIGRVEGHSW